MAGLGRGNGGRGGIGGRNDRSRGNSSGRNDAGGGWGQGAGAGGGGGVRNGTGMSDGGQRARDMAGGRSNRDGGGGNRGGGLVGDVLSNVGDLLGQRFTEPTGTNPGALQNLPVVGDVITAVEAARRALAERGIESRNPGPDPRDNRDGPGRSLLASPDDDTGGAAPDTSSPSVPVPSTPGDPNNLGARGRRRRLGPFEDSEARQRRLLSLGNGPVVSALRGRIGL